MHFSTIKGKGGKVLAVGSKEKKSILHMDVSDILKALKRKNSWKKNDKKDRKKKLRLLYVKKLFLLMLEVRIPRLWLGDIIETRLV